MPKSPPQPQRSKRDDELYTPANITEARTKKLTTAEALGCTHARLLELRRVRHLHWAIAHLCDRLRYGLSLAPSARQWPVLLVGPVINLRGMMGPEEAAPFFVRHGVLPAALSPNLSLAQRRTFLREMRAMPFSEQGKPLGAYPEAAALMSPDFYLSNQTLPHVASIL